MGKRETCNMTFKYATAIFIPEKQRIRLLIQCANEALHDKTFQYTVYADRVIIYSPNRRKAYERGRRFKRLFNASFRVERV